MGRDPKRAECEERRRVAWSPRGRRRWCPGAGRSVAAATTHVPTGWTAFLHWQSVVDALRGRRAARAAKAAQAAKTEAQAPAATVPGTDLPRPEPRAPLPDRRRRAPSDEPALDGWLDATQD